jgi:hypothetical protein
MVHPSDGNALTAGNSPTVIGCSHDCAGRHRSQCAGPTTRTSPRLRGRHQTSDLHAAQRDAFVERIPVVGSFGFAGATDFILQKSADINAPTERDRLSWHFDYDVAPTGAAYGWRSGNNIDLNNSSDWTRVVFTTNSLTDAVPEPSTWAMMILAFRGCWLHGVSPPPPDFASCSVNLQPRIGTCRETACGRPLVRGSKLPAPFQATGCLKVGSGRFKG